MIVIENASEILTIPKGKSGPKKGKEMRDLGIIRNKNIWIENGRIAKISSSLPGEKYEKIDASNKVVLPAFVDSHTHPVFSGYRDFELSQKLQGYTYNEILERGGGIYYTVEKTMNASDSQIIEESSERIKNMIQYGTLSADAKSGYGIEVEQEIRLLKIIKILGEKYPIDLVPTYLVHIIPRNTDEDEYIDKIISRLKEIRELSENIDIFCDKGAFSLKGSYKFLRAAELFNFKLKIHADEIGYIGCSSLIENFGFLTMDHLLKTPEINIKKMAEKGTIAVLLPGTSFTLMQGEYADARKFIKNNVPVALGTDLNPNCYTENMQEIISLSIFNMKMTVEEAISASTLNAAYAIGRGNEIGSIEPGKYANILIADIPSYTHFGYHFGINLIEKRIKNGIEI